MHWCLVLDLTTSAHSALGDRKSYNLRVTNSTVCSAYSGVTRPIMVLERCLKYPIDGIKASSENLLENPIFKV